MRQRIALSLTHRFKLKINSPEKAKPFRLVKYFTFTSLIAIFIGTVALTFINTYWARQMQLKKSEDYALLLVDNLNHQIFTQFFLPAALKFRKIQLRNKEQFEWLDKVIRSTVHSFKVEKVNIYDMSNIISYSFDPRIVGKKDIGGTYYQDAIKGKASSRLIQRGNLIETLIGFPKESKIITFAPLRARIPLSTTAGPVGGVVEIVQDLSEDYKWIFKFQILVISTGAVVMGTLLLILIFVVKRGETIIQHRALERIRLKEQLSRAEHLSSLGEMVAAVSHEIRNPLGIIKSSAELLKKKTAKSDPNNTIPQIVIEESERLNNIITDFLNFARPRKPNLIQCRVEEVIDKNIAFLSSQIKRQNYHIDTDYDQHLPEIIADTDMLYQAFLNILINAMQAMPGGGKIKIAVLSKPKWITIMFADKGQGIPDEIIDKIWSPFFTTKEKGTGLGLGIVRNIVESHEGNIQIENRSTSGARITINLPMDPEKLSWKQF